MMLLPSANRQSDGSGANLILTFNGCDFAFQRFALTQFWDELNRPFHPASLRHLTTLHALKPEPRRESGVPSKTV